MKLQVTPTPGLRILCGFAAAMMVVQVLLLPEADFAVKVVNLLWDKTVHFLYYGTMAFLIWIAAGRRGPLWVWIAVMAIGATDEILQIWKPGRSADIDDWVADSLGSGISLVIATRFTRTAAAAALPANAATETGD